MRCCTSAGEGSGRSRGFAAILLAYGLINLVGGLLSVFPLSWLTFAPEQTFGRYGIHTVYAVAQVPLIGISAIRIVAPSDVDGTLRSGRAVATRRPR